MPSLKDLRNRIDSVKSTKKITQAMKMVAASKLKKAQAIAERGRSYSSGMGHIVNDLVSSETKQNHPLLNNPDKIENIILIIVSSDRGLCGGLNSNIVKQVKNLTGNLEKQNRKITIVCIGKKGYDLLYSFNKQYLNYEVKFIPISEMSYEKTEEFGNQIISSFFNNKYDECYLFYNYFRSVISQEIIKEKLIPYTRGPSLKETEKKNKDVFFEYEPNEEDVLAKILPKNFVVQLYKAVLESRASEQGARMTAMDNATRNAGDMIDNLSLSYNRQRQALITKELIEIISGAEAL